MQELIPLIDRAATDPENRPGNLTELTVLTLLASVFACQLFDRLILNWRSRHTMLVMFSALQCSTLESGHSLLFTLYVCLFYHICIISAMFLYMHLTEYLVTE